MALRYSLDAPEDADRIEQAVQSVLNKGYRTGDIMSEGCSLLSTTEMGDVLLEEMGTL